MRMAPSTLYLFEIGIATLGAWAPVALSFTSQLEHGGLLAAGDCTTVPLAVNPIDYRVSKKPMDYRS